MYLAPMNYDRFFKKVFSDLSIAKRFLEDFFDVEIESIESLKNEHKVTDDSTFVEFDFRCKIDNSYVIIDMQQWYKKDIAQRFYLYHCMNTVLQLETIPSKTVELLFPEKRQVPIKDYRSIEPVITLVWLVDDNLGFAMDFISYSMTPDIVVEFIKNRELWYDNNILELLKKREELFEILSNQGTQFLNQSKLMFLFQKNIVKNMKHAKYEKWFQFAMKTRDKQNKKEDFEEYKVDKVFLEMIRRLERGMLAKDEEQYIMDYEKLASSIERYDKEMLDKGMEIGVKIGVEKGVKIGVEKGEKIGVEKGVKIGVEKGEKIGIEKGEKQKAEEIALAMLKEGLPASVISKLTGLSEAEVEELRKR